MNKLQIQIFFRELSKRFPHPCVVILTGAGAGAVYGRVRATLDLDFALQVKGSKKERAKIWEEFARAGGEVTKLTDIAVQYAEDIDRWSSITFLDYARQSRPWKKFGAVEVRLMAPAYWAIGKLARYLDPDIRDLVEVLRKTKTSWKKVALVTGAAFRKSPKSTACEPFRRQVESFFSNYGRFVWGRKFPYREAVWLFQKSARLEGRIARNMEEIRKEIQKLFGKKP